MSYERGTPAHFPRAFRRPVLMAPQAERSQVVQIAFAASLGNRQYVVRVPETPPAHMHAETVAQCSPLAGRHELKPAIELDGVQSANCAYAAVAGEHLFAEIPGICSQPPFVDA